MRLYTGYETRTMQQHEQDMKELTNRQLLHDYRVGIKEIAHFKEMIARGSKTYLGDNIYVRSADTWRGLQAAIKELQHRGYVISKIKP